MRNNSGSMVNSNQPPCSGSRYLGSGTYNDDGRIVLSNTTGSTGSDVRSVRSDPHDDLKNDTHIDESSLSSAPIQLVYPEGIASLSVASLTSSSTESESSNSPASSVQEDDEISSTDSSGDSCSSSNDSSPSHNVPCQRSLPDLYGQTHPMESPTLIATKLQEFDEQLQRAMVLSTTTTTTTGRPLSQQQPKFQVAERTCPNITTPAFKLMFLRCECFHVENALQRYVRYWEKRVELFGPTRAYQPITLESLYTHNDQTPLEMGAMQIIQRAKSYDTEAALSSFGMDPAAAVDTTAPDERNIMWFDPSQLDPTQYTRESACRAFWYLFHAYLQDDVQVQQRGLICINYSANFSLKNRDPPFTRLCLASIQGCLPIRISVFHGCHPPTIFRFVIRLLLFVMGERLRKRIIPHSGTNDHVNTILQRRYHISDKYIPTDMGGQLSLNVMEWLRQRRDAWL